MSAHTPGPWFWADNVPDAPPQYRMIVDADGYTVCDPSPMSEADARLIAAAPALLDAARCALADLEGAAADLDPSGDRVHPVWRTIKELRDVIERATGGAL